MKFIKEANSLIRKVFHHFITLYHLNNFKNNKLGFMELSWFSFF